MVADFRGGEDSSAHGRAGIPRPQPSSVFLKVEFIVGIESNDLDEFLVGQTPGSLPYLFVGQAINRGFHSFQEGVLNLF